MKKQSGISHRLHLVGDTGCVFVVTHCLKKQRRWWFNPTNSRPSLTPWKHKQTSTIQFTSRIDETSAKYLLVSVGKSPYHESPHSETSSWTMGNDDVSQPYMLINRWVSCWWSNEGILSECDSKIFNFRCHWVSPSLFFPDHNAVNSSHWASPSLFCPDHNAVNSRTTMVEKLTCWQPIRHHQQQ